MRLKLPELLVNVFVMPGCVCDLNIVSSAGRRRTKLPSQLSAKSLGCQAGRGVGRFEGAADDGSISAFPKIEGHHTKASSADSSESEVVEQHTKRMRLGSSRYRLLVDRQTKAFYDTFEETQAEGLLIKKQFALVQVAIYDTRASINTVLLIPA